MEILPHTACDNNDQSNERVVCQMKHSFRPRADSPQERQPSIFDKLLFYPSFSNRDPGSLVVSISNFPKAGSASAHTKTFPALTPLQSRSFSNLVYS